MATAKVRLLSSFHAAISCIFEMLNQDSFSHLPESDICIPKVADLLESLLGTSQKVFQKQTVPCAYTNVPFGVRCMLGLFPITSQIPSFHFACPTFSPLFHPVANATCAQSLPSPFEFLLKNPS